MLFNQIENTIRHGIGLLIGLVGENYSNEVFSLRAYCWCDGEAEGHGEDCPPCFECGDFVADWYKYFGRSFNCSHISLLEWRDMLTRCLASIKESDFGSNETIK
jgi:hypothetical protein